MPVEGPVHLLLEGLPPGRAVVNPSGDYLGTPFIDLKSRSLAPGETEDVTIRFNADSSGRFPASDSDSFPVISEPGRHLIIRYSFSRIRQSWKE
jgi:hypothetical protein